MCIRDSTKHDGPHPVDGIIRRDKDKNDLEYVEFDDGNRVYGSWNDVTGVGRNNKVPVEQEYPLTTGDMYVSEEVGTVEATTLDWGAMEQNRENPPDEQKRPDTTPMKNYKKGYYGE